MSEVDDVQKLNNSFEKLKKNKPKKKQRVLKDNFEEKNTLSFSTQTMFSLPIWSPTLNRYRVKIKPKKSTPKVIGNDFDKEEWDFDEIEDNDQNNDENSASSDPSSLTYTPEDEEEIKQIRRQSANLYCLFGDIAVDFGINKLTPYTVKEDPLADKRRKHLENAVVKVMERKDYKPTLMEELTTAFGVYGYYKFKSLERADKNEKEDEKKKRKKNKKPAKDPDQKIDEYIDRTNRPPKPQKEEQKETEQKKPAKKGGGISHLM